MAAPRNGRNVVSRKMSIWVGHYEPLELLLFVDQSSPTFFAQRGRGSGWWSSFSDVRYVDQFRRYSRSKSKVVRNRAEVWTFFGPPNFFGGGPSKSYTRVINPTSHHVVWKSFVRILPLARKLLRLIRWILSQIFTINFFLGGAPRPSWGMG